MNVESPVNKKQFFFLLYRFMIEKGIIKNWFLESKKYKLSPSYKTSYRTTVNTDFKEDDDFKTHLHKCIDVYMDGGGDMYHNSIYGFFRYIPATFYDNWENWRHISDKWEEKYRHIKFVK